jgi:hypothetical protein
MKKQTGLSLVVVVVLSVAVGLLAVGTLVSMRQERNIFKEILHKATAGKLGSAAPVAAGAAPAPQVSVTPANTLRRCTIDGKTVFSDTECAASQSTEVKPLQVKGVESPKPPPAPASAPAQSLGEKAIERAVR